MSRRKNVNALRGVGVLLAVLILVGPATSAPAPNRTATPAGLYAVPADVARDCSVDVTAALADFIEDVPDHSAITLARNGCYRVEGTLELVGRNGLVIDGQHATIRATTMGDDNRSHWRFVDGSNLTIRDMRIVGANPAGGTASAFVPALQHQMGIDLRGVHGVRIVDVTVEHVYGDCIYVGAGNNSASWTTDVEVLGNTCVASGRSGISVTAGRNVTVTRNSILHHGLWGVDIEPNGGRSGAVGVTVSDNLFTPGVPPRPFVQAVGDSGGGIVSGIAVLDNTVRGGTLTTQFVPAPGQRWSDFTFSENTSNTSGYLIRNSGAEVVAVVHVDNVDGITVEGNYQPGSGNEQTFLYATRSCEVTHSGNTFPGGGRLAVIAPYPCSDS